MDARAAASRLALHGFTTEFRPVSVVAERPAHFTAVRVDGWFRVRAVLPVERHLRAELYIGVLERPWSRGAHAVERPSAFCSDGGAGTVVRSALLFLDVVSAGWI